MKCKRAPYKSYRNTSYENVRESCQMSESAPGPYVIQNPHSSELPTLNFQDGMNALTNSPAIPLETSTCQDGPISAHIQNAEGTKWGEETLKVDLDNNFYSTEVSVSSTENAVNSDLQAGDIPALSMSNGSENSASVISYSGSAPSVIVHSSQFSSVIMHSNAVAAMANNNHKAPSDLTVSPSMKDDSKPEPDKVGRVVSRPKSIKEKSRSTESRGVTPRAQGRGHRL